MTTKKTQKKLKTQNSKLRLVAPGIWRREGDSNPRYHVSSTRDFQSRSFSRLGHLSVLFSYNYAYKPIYLPRKQHKAAVLNLAERVGFEPTCPAINGTSRFRVDPVTATSVPLRNPVYCLFPCGLEKNPSSTPGTLLP